MNINFKVDLDKPEIYYVEWMDSVHEWGDYHPDCIEGTVVLKCVGWLVRSTPDEISLAQEIYGKDETFEVRFVTSIPKVNVLKIIKLPLPKK